MKNLLITITTLLLLYAFTISCIGQSARVGDGKKYHSISTNNLTRCGRPVTVTTTNTVDCKNCLQPRK